MARVVLNSSEAHEHNIILEKWMNTGVGLHVDIGNFSCL